MFLRRTGPFLFLLLGSLLNPSLARADERSTARRFEVARHDVPSLIAFLTRMPKGADLHIHLGGAFYPQDGLDQAIAHHLFFNPASSRFERNAVTGSVPAQQLLSDDPLRYQYLGAASMRGFNGNADLRHDHFFNAFGPLNSGWSETPDEEAIAAVIRRDRDQNLQYVELMESPGGTYERLFAAVHPGQSPQEMMEALRPLLPEHVAASRRELDQWDRGAAERIGIAPPLSAADRPITVRYLASGFRTGPDERVFATWAGAFAVMRADRRLLGVNLVAEEDAPVAIQHFTPQMRLLDFLWKQFGHPNVTLHAGEVQPSLVPLEALRHHIRDSIEIGHARRIGHGTAVAWERDAPGLLREMRQRGIAVEICPTSEQVIQGISGDQSPFLLYRRAGVPVTINTDDEGVLGTNITQEFVRAAQWWHLSYADLKELARNSVEYSFLPGASLFEGHNYRRLATPFRAVTQHGWLPNAAEKRALAASDRATVQLRLERALVEFER